MDAVRLELVRRLAHRRAHHIRTGPEPGFGHYRPALPSSANGKPRLVVQRRRSDYAVPAGRVIPCLVLVAAAQGCAHVREFAS
jgi:hypothetical protein